jgi:DNA-binding GntR family transcriptional regulator
MLALRRRLETRGAARAASRARPEDVAELRSLVDSMEEAARAADDYGLIEIDTAFHMAIFRLAGLRSLDQILQRCILHSHRQKLWEPRHQRSLLETARRHRPVIDALGRGGEALAQALGHHIDTIVDIAPERLAV